jgi:hypothetical protein
MLEHAIEIGRGRDLLAAHTRTVRKAGTGTPALEES